MEIDKSQLRTLLLWFWGIIEKTESDVLAYEVTFALLKSSASFPEIDTLLATARSNPSPELQKRHRETRATIERLLAEQNPGDALMKYLQNWKPKGPIQ
jgi:hypothetical protein